jgi:surface carbohydrate biosynthesis protein (TIGR04326 family)
MIRGQVKSDVPPAAGAALRLLQVDSQEPPTGECTLLWQGAPRHPAVRSLTAYLDTHASEVRKRYLAWVHDLGQTAIGGRKLCERFVVHGATSVWALSLFVEQSIWKQRSLETILKVMALELLLESERFESLAFVGADRDLSRVLELLCRERQIRYSWQRLPPLPARASTRRWRRLRQRLPQTLLGLAAPLYFLIRSWALPRPRSCRATPGTRRMLVCAPFINHSAQATDARDFASQYWTELPKLLAREGYELLWLHLFYPHARIPTAAVAAQLVARIEADSPSSGAHGFVDAYFSVPGLLRVLVRWAAVAFESFVVGAYLRARFAQRPRESFWPLLRSDWACAFRGIECAAALFYRECFDRALASVSRQDEGIYLMENQGWERSLIRAWRRHGHGRLTGVAHSTVRFWDLRYHCDPRRYHFAQRGQTAVPDMVALNGAQALREFLATCASRELVVECEALRYLGCAGHAPPRPHVRSADQPVRLLVLGDFLSESTAQLLRLVEDAVRAWGQTPEVWVKAHPNCPVDAAAVPGLRLRIVREAVAVLAPSVDLVLASNTTSAALDAFLSHARVVVYDDRSGVNFSPLRSVGGVRFVHEALELRDALTGKSADGEASELNPAHFFHTDAALPRWRAYLGIDSSRPPPVSATCGQHAYNEDLAT